jgi:hypothetical protein
MTPGNIIKKNYLEKGLTDLEEKLLQWCHHIKRINRGSKKDIKTKV